MDTEHIDMLFSYGTSFLITFLAIPKIIHFSGVFRLFDQAGDRAAHKGSIPIFGGIAIFSGIIFSLLFWADIEKIQFILVSLLVVFFVGVIDDLLSLSPFRKLIGQIIAVLILVHLGGIRIDNMHGVLGIYELPFWISTLFTIFTVIVITNAFNLIDGVDGLAGGLGIISSCCFGVVALLMNEHDIAIIAFSLVGALLAFLKFNFPPAKIFMGDTGSLLVGMTLAILAVNLIQKGLVTETIQLHNKGPLLAVVFLAIPLFDSLRVFIVRTSKGIGPLSAGRDHIHHALLDLEFGHKKTTITLSLLSLVLISCSFFLLELNINLAIAVLALVSYLILILPFFILRKRK